MPPPPIEDIADLELVVSRDQSAGQSGARLALIEFSDYQCPFCGQHTRGVYQEIMRQFVDTGQVRYFFKNLPLEKIHPLAFNAAVAAECAGASGQFWAMHDRLFANQNALRASAEITTIEISDLTHYPPFREPSNPAVCPL
jgi:protein-disulfide isomerase